MYPASYPDIYPWAVVPGANCFDGDVPIAEKIFGGNRTGTNDTPFMEQYSDYSEVVNLSPGTHTLWYGIRVDSNEPPYGWPGFGWIDIVGIVDPIYVRKLSLLDSSCFTFLLDSPCSMFLTGFACVCSHHYLTTEAQTMLITQTGTTSPDIPITKWTVSAGVDRLLPV
jgi:hypothetical protein